MPRLYLERARGRRAVWFAWGPGRAIFSTRSRGCNVRANDAGTFRGELLRRRRTILETAERAQQELEALRGAERDPEFEEGAQSEHEQYTLSLLGEAQRREVSVIDAALARVDAGEYGVCQDCGIDIDPKRLAVLPFALLCADCASRRERGLVSSMEWPMP